MLPQAQNGAPSEFDPWLLLNDNPLSEPTNMTNEDLWAFENFIQTDETANNNNGALDDTSQDTLLGRRRRRSSSFHVLQPSYHGPPLGDQPPPPFLSHSPHSTSSLEEPSLSPSQSDMLFLDLDHLMPVEKRFRRRRSSSVPPLAHSVYQQQIQHQIQQQQQQQQQQEEQQEGQQQPMPMPSQPTHPQQHQPRQSFPRSLSPSDTMVGSSLPLAQQHQVQLASLLARSMPPQPPTQPPMRSVQIERIARRAAPQVDPQERQRQMIHRLRHVNFEDVTVAELKSLLRFCHLSTTGRKQELIERLKTHHRDP